MSVSIGEEDTFQEISTKLSRAKGTITENNEATQALITSINTLFGNIEGIIENLNTRLVSPEVKTNLITSLNQYITAAESGSPSLGQLQAIKTSLEAIKTSLEGQIQPGGRRTKIHKKSKSKGKGKAAKSKGRKTRRGRSGKAKKSRSRKHTSKRR